MSLGLPPQFAIESQNPDICIISLGIVVPGGVITLALSAL